MICEPLWALPCAWKHCFVSLYCERLYTVAEFNHVLSEYFENTHSVSCLSLTIVIATTSGELFTWGVIYKVCKQFLKEYVNIIPGYFNFVAIVLESSWYLIVGKDYMGRRSIPVTFVCYVLPGNLKHLYMHSLWKSIGASRAEFSKAYHFLYLSSIGQ